MVFFFFLNGLCYTLPHTHVHTLLRTHTHTHTYVSEKSSCGSGLETDRLWQTPRQLCKKPHGTTTTARESSWSANKASPIESSERAKGQASSSSFCCHLDQVEIILDEKVERKHLKRLWMRSGKSLRKTPPSPTSPIPVK